MEVDMRNDADPAGPLEASVSRQVVSYGAGTNSTAMVCEMVRRGEPIAAIVFADTGGERPETYAHVLEFSEWLTARGYPAITTVQQTTKVGNLAVATLEAECLTAKRLPGIAYGFGSCSEKWKQRPFRAWLKRTGWTDVTVCIGFDADEPHRAERGDEYDSGYAKRYPLIEWDMGRDECVAAIDAAGLKSPGKSACFFCPSSKAHEISSLPKALQDRAIALEANADLTTIKGLGRSSILSSAWKPRATVLTANEK
jgi:hypothetical protein